MKALLVSFLSVAVIVTSWAIFVNYADKNIHSLTKVIENEILTSVRKGDWASAEERFDKLSGQWHKQKKVYSFFYNTVDIKATDYSIARAKNYIKTKNAALASGELNCIREQLEFLHQNELITLDNLF